MKTITSRFVPAIMMFFALASFVSKPGGEGFEIYLNGKLWVQQYGHEMKNIKTLSLDKTSPDDQFMIKYHHCGKTSVNRIVTIRDENDKILKEFRFRDVNQPMSAMTIRLGEITALTKSTGLLKLYYTSSELPEGRMLVTMKPGTSDVTRVK